MLNILKAGRSVCRTLLSIAIIALGVFAILGTGGGGGGGGGGNIAPVANDTCAGTPPNTDLTGNLNSNVSDPDSPVLNFTLVGQATKGFVTVDVTGAFTYDPNTGALGMDSFTYTVDDLSGGQDSATVTVLIGGAVRIMPLGDSITSGGNRRTK